MLYENYIEYDGDTSSPEGTALAEIDGIEGDFRCHCVLSVHKEEPGPFHCCAQSVTTYKCNGDIRSLTVLESMNEESYRTGVKEKRGLTEGYKEHAVFFGCNAAYNNYCERMKKKEKRKSKKKS